MLAGSGNDLLMNWGSFANFVTHLPGGKWTTAQKTSHMTIFCGYKIDEDQIHFDIIAKCFNIYYINFYT